MAESWTSSNLCTHTTLQQCSHHKAFLPSWDVSCGWSKGVRWVHTCPLSSTMVCVLMGWRNICLKLLTLMRLHSCQLWCHCFCMLMTSFWCLRVHQDLESSLKHEQASVKSVSSQSTSARQKWWSLEPDKRHIDFVLCGAIVEQVESYKHLGFVVHATGTDALVATAKKALGDGDVHFCAYEIQLCNASCLRLWCYQSWAMVAKSGEWTLNAVQQQKLCIRTFKNVC